MRKIMSGKLLRIFAILLLVSFLHGAKVYLVIGSDTAIWEGMNTHRYNCYYNYDLYTSPTRNAHEVMSSTFRDSIYDSQGTTIKLTWWMMAGNIFRYAENLTLPIPNIMTLTLMKKYHQEAINLYGDELSLHYHTFKWTDYDQDGNYWWNQSLTFNECRDDFDVTLAQFLIEEKIFPVSFRSGWHYMDNDWQTYLNELLPFSMHNDYPNIHSDFIEPTDNNYDWSIATSGFQPYQPSADNYQLPGGSGGWNLRSDSFWGTRYYDVVEAIFESAHSSGEDQILCIWGHLPETDFLENIQLINERAHAADTEYDDVTFEYVTAVEGMQKYLKSQDSLAPVLQMEGPEGDPCRWTISSNEDLFQLAPILAYRDIYGNYDLVKGQKTGALNWEYSLDMPAENIVKWAVSATDSMGNQTMIHDSLYPDIRYIDDDISLFTCSGGDWITENSDAWNLSRHSVTLLENDKPEARWNFEINQSGYYNLEHLWSDASASCDSLSYTLTSAGQSLIKKTILSQTSEWHRIGIQYLYLNMEYEFKMTAYGKPGDQISADVLALSSYVPQTFLNMSASNVQFSETPIETIVKKKIGLYNGGFESLTIENIQNDFNIFSIEEPFPILIESGETKYITIQALSQQSGHFSDTLRFILSEYWHPDIKLPVSIQFSPWFLIIDNEDSEHYFETGEWATSVAEAYGYSSRYAWQSEEGVIAARFKTTLPETGIYKLSFIVPSTVNSAVNAVYTILINNVFLQQISIDQNNNSGNWIELGQFYLPNDMEISIEITRDADPVGQVLRADAVRFEFISNLNSLDSPVDAFKLVGNFPNPFNPSTEIIYTISQNDQVNFKLYNVRGRLIIDRLISSVKGYNSFNLNMSEYGSGIYFYQIIHKNQIGNSKILYMK